MAKLNGKEMYGSDTDLPITSKAITESFAIYQKLYNEGKLRLGSKLTRRQVHEILENGILLQDNSREETYSLAEIIIEQVEGNEWLMKRQIPEHIFRKYGWERSEIERTAVSSEDYEIDSGDSTDDFRVYMNSIRDHPIYSREEQLALGRRIRNGDMQARNILVVSHLRLVARMAKDFHHKSNKRLSTMQFIEWGNEILMDATQTYNPSDGAPFTAYIMPILRRKLYGKMNEYRRNMWMTKSSYKLSELRDEINFFTAEFGREPDVEELVHSMNWKEHLVRRVYRIHQLEKMPFVAADRQQKRPPGAERDKEEEKLRKELDESSYYPRRDPSAEEVYDRKELKAEMDRALSSLNLADRLILELLTGIADGEEHTMRDASEIMKELHSDVKVGKSYQSMKNHRDKAMDELQEDPVVAKRLSAFMPETHPAS
jgi:RNA polymerase sigma factor (sigma-70 family)